MTSSAFTFQPVPLIFLRNHCGYTPRALVQNCIVVVVATHGNEEGRVSSFALKEGGHLPTSGINYTVWLRFISLLLLLKNKSMYLHILDIYAYNRLLCIGYIKAHFQNSTA